MALQGNQKETNLEGSPRISQTQMCHLTKVIAVNLSRSPDVLAICHGEVIPTKWARYFNTKFILNGTLAAHMCRILGWRQRGLFSQCRRKHSTAFVPARSRGYHSAPWVAHCVCMLHCVQAFK